ncbi:MAG: polysaccharide biosynthesis tyrosine autokinase [Verrucomicrobiales bacterium]|nr:polysaccharide biosynthesis tyrosine autokinase [Verrucomicrobiales bacterium]
MDNFKAPEPTDSKLHFLDYWRIIRIRKTVIIAVFLLVVITTTVVTYMLPETFMSSTRIKVEKDASDVGLIGQITASGPPDPFFLQTEFEVIQSKTNLYRVINDLDLNRRWSKEYLSQGTLKSPETFEILRDKIDVRQYRNTTLIEVRVYSRNKAEAAEIANKIAQVYRDGRINEREDMSKRGISQIRETIETQKRRVDELQASLDLLKETNNITDLMMDAYSQGTLEADLVRRTDTLKTGTQSQLARVESTLESLKKMTPERLRNALPTISPGESLLMDLLQREAVAKQEYQVKLETLSKDHPDVIVVTNMIRLLNSQITDRVNAILDGLQTQVASYRTELEQLEAKVRQFKEEDQRRARDYQPYFLAKRKLENEKTMLDLLSRKLAAETFDSNVGRTSLVTVIDPAEEGLKPVKPNIPLNIAFGVLVGLVVGIGLAFFIEYLDTSVKTIDDVERSLQAPVLGVIPQNVGSLLDEGPESPHAEAYRVLRTNILFTRKDETFNTITIVSGGAGEGKSTTLFNLAVIFAQNGSRVLVVDSDLRRPSMHRFFKVSNSLGLTNYLLGQNKLEEVIQSTTALKTLDFLPSGKLPSSSMGILSSAQMKELIAEVKRRYDYVFFDSPPIMGVSDAVVLASEVDISLQVIQYRKYPQAMTMRAKQMVSKVGGYLVGIVLNNINMSQDENYYYYSGYYYDYYQSREKDEASTDEAEPKKNGSGDPSRIDLKKKY